jgi:pimeloyl-ACP methyl ester carboxylesterase
MSDEQGRSDLIANTEAVLAEATALGIADTSRVAILGHSMGSGVALTFGQRYPQTAATIAVSPVGTSVTPVLPRNLLLMAGQNEAGFVRNAEQRLAEAGGSGGEFSAGSKRDLVIIPLVEHLTIVLAPAAHQEARRWLDGTFGAQLDAQDYLDIRVAWYGLGLVGALLASLILAPATEADARCTWDVLPWWRRLVALAAGALGATLALWAVERVAGISLAQSFGLLVGGYLLVWFAIAGVIALLLMFDKSRWAWLDQVDWKIILAAVVVGTALWAGVGWLGSGIWLPWLLIPKRLILWPLGSLLIFPWFLAMGQASSPARAWGRLGWWLAQCGAVIGALVLALNLNSGLFFLVLILPVFPVILGAHALAAGRQRNPWAFGLSAALFISWSLIAVFPLQ